MGMGGGMGSMGGYSGGYAGGYAGGSMAGGQAIAGPSKPPAGFVITAAVANHHQLAGKVKVGDLLASINGNAVYDLDSVMEALSAPGTHHFTVLSKSQRGVLGGAELMLVVVGGAWVMCVCVNDAYAVASHWFANAGAFIAVAWRMRH